MDTSTNNAGGGFPAKHRMADTHNPDTDAAWDISMHAKLKRPNPDAVRLLEVLSFLHPNSIPEFMLRCEANTQVPMPYPASGESYEAAWALLLESSLIETVVGKEELTIHPATQESIAGFESEDELKTALHTVILLLDEAWPRSSFNHIRSRWG
ncbi:hypothetical protein QBC34DRAFT_377735 [Podospora aff. communis PSN243]|uniref:DUF7779 domain-containing protein n=1 Tax=Podospora aff. communis PSN243 TaxID=3040156 RepID=A0AAV9GWZ8_9PEZI|nr:hypothetical protein QBC34DRAFT_377735 [Podospora aff. communis PSN243]